MDNQPENAQNREDPESKRRRVEDEPKDGYQREKEKYPGYQLTYMKVVGDLSVPLNSLFPRIAFQFFVTLKSPFNADDTSLNYKDVQKLDTDGRINDRIMQYVINYIGTYWIKDVSKVFIHNTFFYGSLAKNISEERFWKKQNLEPTIEINQREEATPENKTILSTNCLRLQSWTKKIDLFEKDTIIFPIYEQQRWMALAILNPRGLIIDKNDEDESREKSKCVSLFYDPLGNWDPTIRKRIGYMIKQYMRTVFEKTKGAGQKFGGHNGSTFDDERPQLVTAKNAPILRSPFDCGMYVLHFIEGLTRGAVRPSGPILVNNIPHEFDWSELYPEAEKMCELQRDKIYNMIKKDAGLIEKTRLQIYLTSKKCGLEETARRSRRHSAEPLRRTHRNENYHGRSYSIDPQNLQRDSTYKKPQIMGSKPLSELVRFSRYAEIRCGWE